MNIWYNKAECYQGRDRANCPDVAPWELGLPRTSAQTLISHSAEAVNKPIGLELARGWADAWRSPDPALAQIGKLRSRMAHGN